MDNDDEFGDLYTDALHLKLIPTPSPSPSAQNLPAKEHDKIPFDSSSINPEEEDADVGWLLGREPPHLEEPANWIDDDEEVVVVSRAKVSAGLAKASASEDWDSDSEDDLQIVLNETVRERREGGGSDEEDEDLVIVTDADQRHHHLHQVMEERDRGDDGVRPSEEGEKKETIEVVKANGVGATASGARIGYSNHGLYQQHHISFKYIRPGAAPTPGGSGIVPVGAPGQVRPPYFGLMAGRGRGDSRPAGGRGFPNMQKGFHSGFGLPAWGNSTSGRHFGSGLDFILPSHKTVFDVNIESFEEQPWRYPGADVSDFFNFGLDEEHWKEYSKQVEQLRLESTMQSKIRVYESGRSEQDCDPDLPPELAAATSHHDMSVDNTNHAKPDNGQADVSGQGRESVCMRPPLPTGRAIQVEGGYGERLPSIDTRPPRIRDSDAVIEIVLQDNLEDSTISNGALERQDNNFGGENLKGFHDFDEDDRPAVPEYYGSFPSTSNGKQGESMARRIPLSPERDGILPSPSEFSLRRNSSPKPQSPIDSATSFGTQHGRRLSQGTLYGNSSTSEYSNGILPGRSVHLDKYEGHHKEKAGDGMETNEALELSPSNTVEVTGELGMEPKDVQRDDRLTLGDSIEVDAEEASDFQLSSESVDDDDDLIHSAKRKKSNSCVEQLAAHDNGNGVNSKFTHNDNSLAKSVNSRDHQKRNESGEEVMQDFPLKYTSDFHKHHGEGEHRLKDDYGRDDRREAERNHTISKGREIMLQTYAHKDWDSGFERTFWGRRESFESRVDGSIGAWQRREVDVHSRQVKDGDVRRGRNSQIRSRERIKIRVTNRNEKIEDNIKKSVDGDWRGHSKNGVLRHMERGDISMNCRENREDSQMKRKRDAELSWREKADGEDSLHSYRAREDSIQRKRERDDIMDHRKREDDVRTKSKAEELQSSNHKEDDWYRRDREDQQRLKLSHGDTFLSREREERRLASRSGWPIEKALAGSGMCKEDLKVTGSIKDYHYKDRRWHNEQSKRGDHTAEEYDSLNKVHGGYHAREKRFSTEERSMRHERLSTQPDHPSGDFHGQQVQREKHRENTRKIKDAEHVGQSRGVYGKRKHDDRNTSGTELNSKGSSEQENIKHPTTEGKKSHRNAEKQIEPTAIHGEEDPASDDENHESRRGRSKLERWTSHKERDFSTVDNNIQSSPSMVREAEDSQGEVNEPVKAVAHKDENTETKTDDLVQVADKGGEVTDGAGEERDRHLDTVAKLKMRSERFKLPMPGEKDKDITGNKLENEASQCIQNEAAASTANSDMDIKLERPARKRRWTGS